MGQEINHKKQFGNLGNEMIINIKSSKIHVIQYLEAYLCFKIHILGRNKDWEPMN